MSGGNRHATRVQVQVDRRRYGIQTRWAVHIVVQYISHHSRVSLVYCCTVHPRYRSPISPYTVVATDRRCRRAAGCAQPSRADRPWPTRHTTARRGYSVCSALQLVHARTKVQERCACAAPAYAAIPIGSASVHRRRPSAVPAAPRGPDGADAAPAAGHGCVVRM